MAWGVNEMRMIERLRLVKSPRQRKSFAKDDTAAAAVEFAMVAPVFFLMLGVVLETGLMLFTEYVLQTSTQEAARLVRTGQAHEAKYNAARFKAELCKLAGVIIDCNNKVTVYLRSDDKFDTLATNTPSFMNIGPAEDGTPSASEYNCGAPKESVALIATYDWDFVIPYFMNFLGNRKGDTSRRIAGFAMFKNEPFPVVAGNTCA
jgi:Flp pilus assembly protein TadG